MLFNKFFRAVTLFVLLNLCLLSASAQIDYTISRYNSRNGLPQNSVKSLAFDRNGFIWFTTESGLVRFDGMNFKTYDTRSYPILQKDRLGDLIPTNDSNILFNDELGNIYLLDSLSRGFSLFDSIPGKQEIYLHGGFLDLKQSHFFIKEACNSKSSYLNGPNEIVSFPVSETQIALLTKKEILVIENEKVISKIPVEELPLLYFFMVDNNLYYRDYNNQFFFVNIKESKVEKCSFPKFIPDAVIKWKYKSNGSFIVNANELFMIESVNDTALKATLLTNKLPMGAIVKKVIYDKVNKSIYVGTDSQGLFVYTESKFITLRNLFSKQEYNNVYYSHVAIDSNTVLTHNGYIANKDTVKESPYNFSFNSHGIAINNENKLVFGISKNLFSYNLKTKEKNLINKDEDAFPFSFFSEGDSTWVCYEERVAYVKNDTLINFFIAESQKKIDRPYQILRGVDNTLWIVTCKGVYTLNTQNRELGSIEKLKNLCIRNVSVFNDYAFIATYGSGFYLFKNNKLVSMPLDPNGDLKFCHAFIRDKNNFIWITTNRGLFKVPLFELVNFFNGKSKEVFYFQYDEYDGINNAEFNGGCYPNYVRLKNGYISLPSIDGLVWFQPENILDPSFLNPIVIDKITLDNIEVRRDKKLLIPSFTNDIEIQLATAYKGNIKNLIVEYKIIHNFSDGENWTRISNFPLQVKLSGLQSGEYKIQLRKRCGWGSNNYIYNYVEFQIDKKYYETWWFWVISTLGVIGIITAISWLNAYNYRKKNERLEKKVNERTVELVSANKKLQDSIQVKDNLISIISHDIITPLKFISIVAQKSTQIKNNTNEKLIASLKEIDFTTESLYSNAQNILNWIKYNNNRIDVQMEHVAIGALVEEIIDNYNYLAGMRGNKLISNISFEEIIYTDKNILLIVLYNLLTNAIKFTENGTISFGSFASENSYQLIITDTGIGIAPEKLKMILTDPKKAALQKETPLHVQTGHGMGFIIVSELLTLINGSFKVESEVGKGTTVTVHLKLN